MSKIVIEYDLEQDKFKIMDDTGFNFVPPQQNIKATVHYVEAIMTLQQAHAKVNVASVIREALDGR